MYQFSPYFYHQLYSPRNGFELMSAFIGRNSGLGWKKTWWEFQLEDSRLSPVSGPPITLLILARKVSEPHANRLSVYQRDYELVWEDPVRHGRLLGKPFEGTSSRAVGLLRRSPLAPVARTLARYVADPWSPVRRASTQIYTWFIPSLGTSRCRKVRPSRITHLQTDEISRVPMSNDRGTFRSL